jgi:hypothetical protein
MHPLLKVITSIRYCDANPIEQAQSKIRPNPSSSDPHYLPDPLSYSFLYTIILNHKPGNHLSLPPPINQRNLNLKSTNQYEDNTVMSKYPSEITQTR